MVKPTVSSDAIVSHNRFAVLGWANFDSQNPSTLTDVTNSAVSGTLANNNKGAISKNSGIVTVKNTNKVNNHWIPIIKVSKFKAVTGATP